ncbi:MAG: peptidoglycan DD-metalloendopeptidase family protein [Christensenellales bacterium]
MGAVRPVSGGLLRGFSAQPVLWPSLDCWQAHPAVDLGAASGETAVCMRDGVVLSCVRDDLWGWHVAVRQTDGAICTYSGLSCALVQAGQRVVRGQPLGDVMAAVPAESELGAHLHLSLYRDGEATEPALPD